MTYAEKLKHPQWQRKRLLILQRDNFTCKTCGDTETELHIHHLEYTKSKIWEELDENLTTLCKYCHELIEVCKNDNLNVYEYEFKIKHLPQKKAPEEIVSILKIRDLVVTFKKDHSDAMKFCFIAEFDSINELHKFCFEK